MGGSDTGGGAHADGCYPCNTTTTHDTLLYSPLTDLNQNQECGPVQCQKIYCFKMFVICLKAQKVLLSSDGNIQHDRRENMAVKF